MTSHRTVDRARNRLTSRDLALVASFAALIAVLGLPGAFLLPGNPVPITLQTLGVMLAGSILGWKRGALSVMVLLLVAAGLPLLSGGRTTITAFAGPSAGFSGLRAEVADLLLRRIDGVLKIRDSKLLLFQAARAAVPGLLAMLDDAEEPTVTAVHDSDQLALQALCHGTMTWQRLEELKRAGARGLLVLPIERMLA